MSKPDIVQLSTRLEQFIVDRPTHFIVNFAPKTPTETEQVFNRLRPTTMPIAFELSPDSNPSNSNNYALIQWRETTIPNIFLCETFCPTRENVAHRLLTRSLRCSTYTFVHLPDTAIEQMSRRDTFRALYHNWIQRNIK